MDFMTAFGLASIMLCIGMVLRAKIVFFKRLLVPASVIGGMTGMLFINLLQSISINAGTDTEMYTLIVNNLFTVSFISITLTSTTRKTGDAAKSVMKGAVAIGLIWCLLYAVTPLAAFSLLYCLEKSCDMNPVYGLLIQFGFCQGPGQAATYGAIFEQYGWENSAVVAITFSVIGFLAAFLAGIPAAKWGIKIGIAKNRGQLDDATMRGYLRKNEQTERMVKDTTCSSNIETLTFHFALLGICYILAVVISGFFKILPGFLGETMSAMMFMNGMYAAYLVKWILKKLKIDFLIENTLQNKITGWTSDYLVVCAFMAISFQVIQKWLIPIVAVSLVTTVITLIVCFYLGQRIGGTNDYERTLGLYGTCTGTVPSGIALVRIVDPDFKTSTAVELGAMNLVMIASSPVYMIILALVSGTWGIGMTIAGLAGCTLFYLIGLKLTKSWGKKTYSWKTER